MSDVCAFSLFFRNVLDYIPKKEKRDAGANPNLFSIWKIMEIYTLYEHKFPLQQASEWARIKAHLGDDSQKTLLRHYTKLKSSPPLFFIRTIFIENTLNVDNALFQKPHRVENLFASIIRKIPYIRTLFILPCERIRKRERMLASYGRRLLTAWNMKWRRKFFS